MRDGNVSLGYKQQEADNTFIDRWIDRQKDRYLYNYTYIAFRQITDLSLESMNKHAYFERDKIIFKSL